MFYLTSTRGQECVVVISFFSMLRFVQLIRIIVGLVLAYNSLQKIMSFRGTSQKVVGAQKRLEQLKEENERLKNDLEYKKSERFIEEEIRNKLGLAREGEEVFAVPKDVDRESLIVNEDEGKPNWQKWRQLLFGT